MKKKATKSATPARKMFGGKGYTKTSCSRTKTAAKKEAEAKRKSGKLARVVADKAAGRYCVYTRSAK